MLSALFAAIPEISGQGVCEMAIGVRVIVE